jgi:ATP-dependent 26S proteasome regulatory subunit
MSTSLERLKLLINSSTPIVLMETVEEGRCLELMRQACAELNVALFEWSIADGLQRSGVPTSPSAADPRQQAWSAAPQSSVGDGPILNTQQPASVLAHIETLTVEAVFLLKDFHRHLDDVVVVRRLREVAQQFARSRRALVLTGPSLPMPPELEKEVEYLDLPLPDAALFRQLVEQTFARLAKTHRLKRTLDAAGLEAAANNLRGLTEDEAERALSQAIIARYALCPEVVTDVLEAKKEALRRSGMLEFIEASDSMANIGGLENLKKWLRQRQGAWEDSARAYGLDPPRGVIIMGVQGCGKSLCARAIAGEWKLPLVKFDTAAVYDKYIGETEKHIRKIFRVAEQLAPAVLWIDELEKVFAGSGPDSASSDAGTSARLLGSFLGWMQDHKAPVFVAATSNNVEVLPPELIRKGRFDEIFFVGLPHPSERRAIFEIQLKRRKLDPETFDLEALVAASEAYSGAEIEATVQSAMYAGFSARKPVSTAMVLGALASTVPLSTTRAEDIDRLREWARERAVPASGAERAKGD